jgi:hypothetical protein
MKWITCNVRTQEDNDLQVVQLNNLVNPVQPWEIILWGINKRTLDSLKK